jgi:alpha-N-arabinofuranosidase
MREENGHKEPYNVKYWGVGNTDENVWHIDYNNPVAYAQTYLRYQTVLREDRKKLYFIGLGLSTRHHLPSCVGKALDHITGNQRNLPPDALSVHHYLGAAKGGCGIVGDAVEYSDEGYYGLLDLLERYQYDIDLHRVIINEHAGANASTKICFDEWGTWPPEATFLNNQNQRQTMRDGIFAALVFHIFYKNSDIVEFSMVTQLCNLLQSLFETSGDRCFKTPTYYVLLR